MPVILFLQYKITGMKPLEKNFTGDLGISASEGTIKGNPFIEVHWNRAYTETPETRLGWHENDPEVMLELIDSCKVSKDALLLIAGSGSTLLVDRLLQKGYSKLIATDISQVALTNLEDRIGPSGITYITDDLTNPDTLKAIDPVSIWVDRAVLHFFLEAWDQATYFSLLKEKVLPGGYAIFAEFNLSGAIMCSGLPVLRYDVEMLQERLGSDFSLIKSFEYDFINPSGGIRPYVYALFQRKT